MGMQFKWNFLKKPVRGFLFSLVWESFLGGLISWFDSFLPSATKDNGREVEQLEDGGKGGGNVGHGCGVKDLVDTACFGSGLDNAHVNEGVFGSGRGVEFNGQVNHLEGNDNGE